MVPAVGWVAKVSVLVHDRWTPMTQKAAFTSRTRFFLCALIAALTPVCTRAENRPNVIVILADDQAWGDLSVNGNMDIATPRIDSLARSGAVLDRFFVSPVCSPTRAEFLTGRYFGRTGVTGVSEGKERLNLDETTIAQVFKSAGYATGAFGKWHN